VSQAEIDCRAFAAFGGGRRAGMTGVLDTPGDGKKTYQG